MTIDLSKMKSVSITKGVMGGEPCLGKHRIAIAQLLLELANGDSVQLLEDSYCLEIHELDNFLRELAEYFDKLKRVK